MVMRSMLTTTDNPFNPFDQYDEWYAFDNAKGYHTPSFLARVVVTSEELSENAQHEAIDLAIDEIVEENVLGLYKKISKEIKDEETSLTI